MQLWTFILIQGFLTEKMNAVKGIHTVSAEFKGDPQQVDVIHPVLYCIAITDVTVISFQCVIPDLTQPRQPPVVQ